MKKRNINKNLATYGIVIIGFLISYIMVMTGFASRHFESMLVPIGVNIIVAVSLNLIVGFLGELNLGQAGFMSVGAYAGCMFSIYTEEIIPSIIRFPVALLVGGIVAGIFGLIIGIPVLRLRGDYLAIVTLAFGEILRSVIINVDFLGGASGLKGTPQDTNFINTFVVIIITLFIVMNLVNSRAGRAITSIRDNRIATQSIGISVTNHKLLAFMTSAFFAGVAGVLYGHNLSILQASTFDYNKSIEILVIVVLGGMGNVMGTIISATLITVLPEVLRGAQDYRMLIYAIVLIVMMLFNGSGKKEEFMERYFSKRSKKEVL